MAIDSGGSAGMEYLQNMSRERKRRQKPYAEKKARLRFVCQHAGGWYTDCIIFIRTVVWKSIL